MAGRPAGQGLPCVDLPSALMPKLNMRLLSCPRRPAMIDGPPGPDRSRDNGGLVAVDESGVQCEVAVRRVLAGLEPLYGQPLGRAARARGRAVPPHRPAPARVPPEAAAAGELRGEGLVEAEVRRLGAA